jgi:hypothetical protein
MNTAHETNIRNRTINEALVALRGLAEPRRLARVPSRPIQDLTLTTTDDGGRIIMGRIRGADGVVIHHPRINIGAAGRSFSCTCPDHQRRARHVGPCKHVLSLAGSVAMAV